MIVVGVDEAGRGCWAGPLVAAAVILDHPILGLTDSKKLSKRQRDQLAVEIKMKAVAYGLGWVQPNVIDAIGLIAATQQAMREALHGIDVAFDQIIIDGNYDYLSRQTVQHPSRPKPKHSNEGKEVHYKSHAIAGNMQRSVKISTLVGADSKVAAVSAASILAKVARDEYMYDIAAKYPDYQFERHVGYGTALHLSLLKLHGVSDIHRLSYKPIQALLRAADV